MKKDFAGERVTVQEILDAFHERGFGFFLFLIALPASLPVPALGLNLIIALPLILLTFQQMVGRRNVWVPHRMRAKTIKTSDIHATIEAALPWIRKGEFFIRPRFGWMTQGIFSHIIGFSGLLMALFVLIPLPLTNTVPSLGIVAMSVGVLMRDGLAVLVGMLIGLVWMFALTTAMLIFGLEGLELLKELIKSWL